MPPVSLSEAVARLRAAGVEAPAREARILWRVAGEEAAAFARAVARRVAREPVALIEGRRGFWTLELEVSRETLIPRPESETLIEAALAAWPERGAVRRILDLGTGTGCLLLAALTEFPGAFGVGVDLAPGAARLAARNAVTAGLGGRAAFVAGDWGEAVAGGFDLVLCNPPYIESGAMAGLMPEVRLFEPARALDGGVDGLASYRRVMAALARLLRGRGVGVVELGAGQAAAVAALAAAAGLAVRAVRDDLAGVARAMVLSRGLGALGSRADGE